MADEQSFPTAIIPARPGSAHERFDLLARRLGDPMAKLFLLQATSLDPELQFKAAAELMPYRYPKLRVQETKLSAADGAGVSITINIGGPPIAPPADPVAAAVDVTPPKQTAVDPLD